MGIRQDDKELSMRSVRTNTARGPVVPQPSSLNKDLLKRNGQALTGPTMGELGWAFRGNLIFQTVEIQKLQGPACIQILSV